MKKLTVISSFILLCILLPKLTSANGYEITFDAQEIYDQKIIDKMFETQDIPGLSDANLKGLKKIIIIDQLGNKIREEYVKESFGFCSNSTLLPLIYKCSFITEINGACYFLLNQYK